MGSSYSAAPKWVLPAIGLAAIAGGLSGALVTAVLHRGSTPHTQVLDSIEPDPNLVIYPAERIYTAFQTDREAATKKYWRRFVSVRGKVRSTKWTSSDPCLYLAAGKGVLACEFPETQRRHIEGLRDGDEVVIRGWCSNAVGDGTLGKDKDLPDFLPLQMCNVEQVPAGRKGFNLADSVPITRASVAKTDEGDDEIDPEFAKLLAHGTIKDWKQLSFAKKVGLTGAAAKRLHPDWPFDPSVKRAGHYFHSLNGMVEEGTAEDSASLSELIKICDIIAEMRPQIKASIDRAN